MERAGEHDVLARTRAVLVDPVTMTVRWMNEAAASAAEARGSDLAGVVPVERVVPMVEGLGVAEALGAVADTGEPLELRADLISGAQGSVALVIAVHRLPSGELLVLMENAYVAERGARGADAPRRSDRRRR